MCGRFILWRGPKATHVDFEQLQLRLSSQTVQQTLFNIVFKEDIEADNKSISFAQSTHPIHVFLTQQR